MKPERNIEPFSTWREMPSEAKGHSIQFSQMTGLSLTQRETTAEKDGSVITTFSVRPKPLKWKGQKNWNRVTIKIKNDGTFCAIVDKNGTIGFRHGNEWAPISKAMEVMKKVESRIKKADNE